LLVHLELATTFQLPLIFHCVNAHGRLLDILGSEGVPYGGMIHSFSGSVEVMKRYVSLGLMVSFSGLITRPSASRAREAAANIPEEHLLIETDAPDQRPVGVGEEESPFMWLPRILSELSTLRKRPSNCLREITTENARKLFRLDREMPSGG
jgi:TatD DNase family protein